MLIDEGRPSTLWAAPSPEQVVPDCKRKLAERGLEDEPESEPAAFLYGFLLEFPSLLPSMTDCDLEV